MNNYEKIKQMKVDEMANFLSNRAACGFCIYEFDECNEAIRCVEGIKQWLLQEVEE